MEAGFPLGSPSLLIGRAGKCLNCVDDDDDERNKSSIGSDSAVIVY